MWIKICGNTSLEDAQLAVDAGADAVGFIFAESARRVTADRVHAITTKLPASIEKYGVFVDPSLGELIHAVEESGLTGIQLHRSHDPALPLRLREHFAGKAVHNGLSIFKVIHYQEDLAGQLKAAQADAAIDAVLVDSRTATMLGGTGQRYDWQAASSSFREAASRLKLIAAGGLNPGNVAEAIATLRPWGVDVVTGVEASPGKKDPAKVREFVSNARIAAHKAKLEMPVTV
jgi:phosphoribosylanthranilate isomerase